LLAKPVPRSWLLMGKALGVLVFMTFQMSVFIFGTWLALGLRTGIWASEYLLCLPIVIVEFFAIFSVSVFLAVLTRSTVVCIVGSVGFWALCYAVNYAHHAQALSTDSSLGLLGMITELGYWILPKPTDLVVLVHRLLEAGKHFNLTPELEAATFSPWLSVLTS